MAALNMRASATTTTTGADAPGETAPPFRHMTPPRRRSLAGARVNSVNNNITSREPGGGGACAAPRFGPAARRACGGRFATQGCSFRSGSAGSA